MMLSQTFYRMNQNPDEGVVADINHEGNFVSNKVSYATSSSVLESSQNNSNVTSDSGSDTEEDDEGEIAGRGVGVRQYLKEVLIPHPIWNDGKFWEQVLWECALEQLQTIPYDVPWHDMSTIDRREAVRRVHNVVMSQVMAVEHSMLELGCTHRLVREFIYRMCVIHQLTESQKHMLVSHLQSRSVVTVKRSSKLDDDALITSI